MKTMIQKALMLTLTITVLLPMYALALGPGFNTDVYDGCNVPLDGGLSLLAAAGVGYTVKKVVDHRKKKQRETAK